MIHCCHGRPPEMFLWGDTPSKGLEVTIFFGDFGEVADPGVRQDAGERSKPFPLLLSKKSHPRFRFIFSSKGGKERIKNGCIYYRCIYLLAIWMVACLTFCFHDLWRWPWSDSFLFSGSKRCTKHGCNKKYHSRRQIYHHSETLSKQGGEKQLLRGWKKRSSHYYGDGLKQQIMGTSKNPTGLTVTRPAVKQFAPWKLPKTQ